MSTFKVLQNNEGMMMFVGLYPSPPTVPSRLSRLRSFLSYFTIAGMCIVTTLAAIYVHHGYQTIRLQYLFEALALVRAMEWRVIDGAH